LFGPVSLLRYCYKQSTRSGIFFYNRTPDQRFDWSSAMDLHRIDASLRHFLRQTARKLGDLPARSSHSKIATVDGSRTVLGSENLEELELLSESLHIDTEMIRDGEISIRKEVIVETQVIHVPVKREELVIERRSADGKSVELLHGQNQLRIPISKERVIIKKEPVISEVVTIRRRTIGETKKISEMVRHEDLRIDGEGGVNIVGEHRKQANRLQKNEPYAG
jgi:uncharacterized protein (TIGR02271 family)